MWAEGGAIMAAMAAGIALVASAVRWAFGLTIVGVTGGIASGKSSYCEGLRRRGDRVIDLDSLAHRLQRPGTAAWTRIRSAFAPAGTGVDSQVRSGLLNADYSINRVHLGAIVFEDDAKRLALNRIMHGLVARELLCEVVRTFVIDRVATVYIEGALLFETGLARLCDLIVVVTCTDDRRLVRLCERSPPCDQDQARRRIRSQHMSQAAKVARADVVVDNNGAQSDLVAKAEALVLPERSRLRPTVSSILFAIVLIAAVAAIVAIGDLTVRLPVVLYHRLRSSVG